MVQNIEQNEHVNIPSIHPSIDILTAMLVKLCAGTMFLVPSLSYNQPATICFCPVQNFSQIRIELDLGMKALSLLCSILLVFTVMFSLSPRRNQT
jgi:hypothetical protein